MKAPLLLDNQKDGNFDDGGHFDDFKSWYNPNKAAGPMHAQVTEPKKASKAGEAKPAEAAKKDAKKAEEPKKLGEKK